MERQISMHADYVWLNKTPWKDLQPFYYMYNGLNNFFIIKEYKSGQRVLFSITYKLDYNGDLDSDGQTPAAKAQRRANWTITMVMPMSPSIFSEIVNQG